MGFALCFGRSRSDSSRSFTCSRTLLKFTIWSTGMLVMASSSSSTAYVRSTAPMVDRPKRTHVQTA